MPYIGQPPVSGDTTKSFRLLDNLASFTLSFDATSSSVVDTSANTLTFANHRFVTAQRVTYDDGGGTAIGGLTDGTAYFIIKVDQNTIQLASSASNANNGTAISLSSGAVGSHTLNLAFDGTNTKFKATYANGTKAKISRAGQLLISINGVLQQAQESSTPTLGFGLDSDSTIVFSQAPVSTDVLFGQILADTITNFDTQDNTLDVFTGDGSTTTFNLSKKPASNNDILVTLDGVVQYPTTTSTSNAYSVTESTLTFTAAPADGVAIQVRHIGFAGATSSAVTGLYGRTGNVTLSSSDDDITVGNVTAGIITATSFGSISGTTASFSGNVSVGGTLTYEDVTNIDSVGLITARNGVKFGTSGTTVFGDSNGIGIGTTNPSYLVDAHTSSGNAQLRVKSGGDLAQIFLESTDTSGYSQINFADADSSNIGMLQYFHSDNHMEFTVNGSEAARFDSSGRLLIGTSSSRIGGLLQVESTGSSNDRLHHLSHNTNTSESAVLRLIKSRGTTAGAVTAVQNDDNLGYLVFTGTDGTGNIDGAYISGEVNGTPATNNVPTDLLFWTNSGAASPTERMRLNKNGQLMINTTTKGVADADTLTLASGSSTGITIRSSTSGNGNVFFSDATSGVAQYDGFIQYQHSSQVLKFGTASTEGMRLDSSGRLLIGTTTEGHPSGDDLTLATTANTGLTIRSGTSNYGAIFFSDGTSGNDEYRGYIEYEHSNNYIRFGTNAAERMRIDSSGRLLVNHTSDTAPDGFESKIQTVGTDYRGGSLSIRRDGSNSSGPALVLTKSRSSSVGGNTVVQDGDSLGSVWFYGADGNDTNQAGAKIECQVDDTPGSNDMPGRLVFATTTNATASPSERMRITNPGYLKVSNSASYNDAGAAYHEFVQSGSSVNMLFRTTKSNTAATQVQFGVDRAATSAYWFIQGVSSWTGSADTEFYIRGDGNAYADGSWTGGGADYAEYFEWSDGNTEAEDRRGISVVLDGDKIREAVAGEEPIGVISGNPSVVGDGDVDRWKGKYLHDDYGSYVLDEDGYRQLNPDYDSSVEYVQREDRAEWDTVGLMGKLRVRKGQVTGTRWIKMRDVSNTVEEWLVR